MSKYKVGDIILLIGAQKEPLGLAKIVGITWGIRYVMLHNFSKYQRYDPSQSDIFPINCFYYRNSKIIGNSKEEEEFAKLLYEV